MIPRLDHQPEDNNEILNQQEPEPNYQTLDEYVDEQENGPKKPENED